MYTLILTEKEREQAIYLFDVATRAQGLAVAKMALALSDKIRAAEKVQDDPQVDKPALARETP